MNKKPYEPPSLETHVVPIVAGAGSASDAHVLEAAQRHSETGCRCGVCWQCRCAEHVRRQSVDLNLSEQAKRISAALSELARFGSSICKVLDACSKGATLEVQGDGPAIRAWLENGSRSAHTLGNEIAQVFDDLARKWDSTTRPELPDTERPPRAE